MTAPVRRWPNVLAWVAMFALIVAGVRWLTPHPAALQHRRQEQLALCRALVATVDSMAALREQVEGR